MSQPYNPPPAGPPAKSGGGMSVLMIVLIVLVVLGLICAGACGVCMYGVGQAVKEGANAFMAVILSVQAQGAVSANEEVKAKLGEPLTFGEVKDPKINLTPPNSTATFDFPVNGPNGSGTVHVEGSQVGEEWKINVLEVRCDDGTVIKVDPTANPVDINLPNFDNMPDDASPTPDPGDTEGVDSTTPDESN